MGHPTSPRSQGREPVATSVSPLLCALLALSVLSLPGCRKRGPVGPEGPEGPAASIDTQKPAAPANLRLEPHPAGAPNYVLRWDEPAGSVPVKAFVVYASSEPILSPDLRFAVAAVPANVHFAELTLLGDTGLRHLRVTAVSITGVESPPSAEHVVETTARILFFAQASAGTGAYRLCSQVPAAPTPPVSLTPASDAILSFQPSPDGRHVALVADLEALGQHALYVVPSDGSAPPKKVSGTLAQGSDVAPEFGWSPAGDRLAFAADATTPGVVEVYVVAVDGSSRVAVSGTMVPGGGVDATAGAIAWAPDGRTVAYLARQRHAQVREAFVGPADGSSTPLAISGDLLPGSAVTSLAWAPDGRQVALVARRGNAIHELFVAPPDRTSAPAVRSGLPLPGSDVQQARWSPDGTRLAFLARRNGGLQVHVTRADEEVEPVPVDAGFAAEGIATSFAWSPDATQIAFTASADGESIRRLFVAPAAGGVGATIVSGTAAGTGSVSDFAWSPDGAQVAFLRLTFSTFRTDLFVATPRSSATPVNVSGNQGSVITVERFDWSSEGDRLAFRAFTSSETNELFVVHRFGGPVVAIEGAAVDFGSQATDVFDVAFPHLGANVRLRP